MWRNKINLFRSWLLCIQPHNHRNIRLPDQYSSLHLHKDYYHIRQCLKFTKSYDSHCIVISDVHILHFIIRLGSPTTSTTTTIFCIWFQIQTKCQGILFLKRTHHYLRWCSDSPKMSLHFGFFAHSHSL